MKTPKMLNSLLNVIIFLIALALFIGIIVNILTLTGVTPDFISSETLKNYTENTPDIYIFMVLTFAVYFVFVYGLWHLKKAAKQFVNNNFYSIKISKHITISGKCMVLSGVFWWLFDGLSSMHFSNSISIGVSEKTFVYLFIVAIGLFMMLMGKVFDNARILKEENDLTI